MNSPLTIGLDGLSRLAKEAGAEADAQARAAGITPAAESIFGEAGKGRKGGPRARWIVYRWIDSDAHYAEGNLQIVCRFANRWKNNDQDSNFRRLIAAVRHGQPVL